jgi:histidinol-phosphate aminotransferase
MGIPDGLEVVLGNGSDEIIQIVSLALARPGAVVLAPEPSFVMYRMSALAAGMRYVGVPLASDFSLNAEALLEAIRVHRPALTWLAYPNNPTGNLFPASDVERIIRAAPGIVVVDEAYYAYADSSFLPRVLEFPNLIVVRTVSKIGLAGVRLGYAVAHPGWIAEIEKVRPPYNVNVLTQAAALFALERLDVLEEQAARIRADRALLGEAIAALPGTRVFPSEANFFLVRVKDADATYDALRRQGVLVRNLHPGLDNCLRINVGTPDENRILLTALREALR